MVYTCQDIHRNWRLSISKYHIEWVRKHQAIDSKNAFLNKTRRTLKKFESRDIKKNSRQQPKFFTFIWKHFTIISVVYFFYFNIWAPITSVRTRVWAYACAQFRCTQQIFTIKKKLNMQIENIRSIHLYVINISFFVSCAFYVRKFVCVCLSVFKCGIAQIISL